MIPIVSSTVSQHHEVSDNLKSLKLLTITKVWRRLGQLFHHLFLITCLPLNLVHGDNLSNCDLNVNLSIFSFFDTLLKNPPLTFFQQILVTLLLLGALLAATEGKRRGGKPKKVRSGRVSSAITQHQIIILERGRIKTLPFFTETYIYSLRPILQA